MSKPHDVSIYYRNLRLDVIIPEQHVWEFMKQFGPAFAAEDITGGQQMVKAVDGYYKHPHGWHVQVTIWENDEERFYDFLQKFCAEKNLSFRDPRQP